MNNKDIVIKLFILAICSAGLSWQLTRVSELYFSFSTTTYVQNLLSSMINVPSLCTCFRFMDIINITLSMSMFGVQLQRWYGPNFNRTLFDNLVDNLTVSQVLLLSPPSEEILEKCVIRYPSKLAASTYDQDQCLVRFKIEKFLQREYVCYKFTPRIQEKELMIEEYSLSPDFVGTIFRLQFKVDLFSSVLAFTSFVKDSNSSDHFDSIFSTENLNRNLDRDSYPNIGLTFHQVSRIFLEPPFDTACTPISESFQSASDLMMSRINNESMETFNRVVPFVPIGNEEVYSNYKLIQLNFLRNEELVKKLISIIDKYKGVRGCEVRFFITNPATRKDRYIRFTLYWPRDPTVEIRYLPKQELIDYVVYVCSSIGIWFGLSVFSSLEGGREFLGIIKKRYAEKGNGTGVRTERTRDKLTLLSLENSRLNHNQRVLDIKVYKMAEILKSILEK